MKITVAYVGTRFAGWQRQLNAPTVQETIERAAAVVEGGAVAVHGAGRTDAGVHARGQVAHFDTARTMEAGAWLRALNAHLPDDVRVSQAMVAAPDFHARHSAGGKTYSYRLDLRAVPSPFDAPFAWHVGPEMDLDALRNAANALLGPLDQRAFATQPETGGRPQRPLTAISVAVDAGQALIVVEGRSFLRHAVRGMVGTMVEVGRGRRETDSVRAAARSGIRADAGATAPAHGLCLERVHYDAE
jgi:tRNA pseudouridine38-40 synthase